MKKLFIITGEHSGDIHAADVVHQLKSMNSDILIEAVGGAHLAAEGIKLFCDHSEMSSVGFGFKMILKHLILGKKIARYLKDEFKPDMVLMIDYGGFNLNLSKVLSKYGIKIYYYIPPQIWASRKWRIKTVKKNISKVLTIFPFEKEMYEKEGIDAEFVGHPLLSEMPEKYDKTSFIKENGLNPDKKLISIFTGSRVFEIKNLLKTFLDSARIIHQKNKDVQFVICQAQTIKDELINNLLNKYSDLNIKVFKNKNYELLSVSDALILASGTVALEAALYETPMIISYKGPWFLYLIYLSVRSIKKVSLPNIITGKDPVPELIQLHSNSKCVSKEVLKIINNTDYSEKMKSELAQVRACLGRGKASENVANIIKKNI